MTAFLSKANTFRSLPVTFLHVFNVYDSGETVFCSWCLFTAAQLLQSTPLATAAAQTAEEAGPNLGCFAVSRASLLQVQSFHKPLYGFWCHDRRSWSQGWSCWPFFRCMRLTAESTRSESFLPRQGVWQWPVRSCPQAWKHRSCRAPVTKLGVFGAAVCFDVSYQAKNDMIQCIARIVVALNLFCIFTHCWCSETRLLLATSVALFQPCLEPSWKQETVKSCTCAWGKLAISQAFRLSA